MMMCEDVGWGVAGYMCGRDFAKFIVHAVFVHDSPWCRLNVVGYTMIRFLCWWCSMYDEACRCLVMCGIRFLSDYVCCCVVIQ